MREHRGLQREEHQYKLWSETDGKPYHKLVTVISLVPANFCTTGEALKARKAMNMQQKIYIYNTKWERTNSQGLNCMCPSHSLINFTFGMINSHKKGCIWHTSYGSKFVPIINANINIRHDYPLYWMLQKRKWSTCSTYFSDFTDHINSDYRLISGITKSSHVKANSTVLQDISLNISHSYRSHPHL